MSAQAYKTPLLDLLRNVPKSHRTEWPIQLSEDGREIGRAMCPIGRLVHEAADRIMQLEAIQTEPRFFNEWKISSDKLGGITVTHPDTSEIYIGHGEGGIKAMFLYELCAS